MANVLSTTLTALRQGFLESIGEWYSGTTSGAGAAGGTTFVDATDRINEQDDFFQWWWAYITSGTYSGQIRRGSTSAQSTGTITVLSAYGGQIAASVTYELCRYHPVNVVRWALNRAILEVWPNLGRSIINEDLITDNWLPNGSFEDWDVTSTPNKWAVVGAGATAAEDTTNKLYGSSGLSLARSGTDCYVHCSDTQWPQLLDLGGYGVRFEAWVKCATASRARLSIYVGGSSVATSSYHTGGNNWELLRTDEVTITDSPASISFRCEVNTGNVTAYFDFARAIGPQLTTYLMPLSFSVAEPRTVEIQASGTPHGNERPCDDQGEVWPFTAWSGWNVHYDDTLGAWLLRLSAVPPAGYKIRLRGTEYMSTVTAEADTIPMDPPQTHMLYAKAAENLFSKLAYEASGEIRQEYEAKMQQARGQYETLKRTHGRGREPLKADFGRWRY